MKQRPEYVACITRNKNETWCGRPQDAWCFVSIDHAAENGAKGGRLVCCPQCRDKIVLALESGKDERRQL